MILAADPPQPCSACSTALASCDGLQLYRGTTCCTRCFHPDDDVMDQA